MDIETSNVVRRSKLLLRGYCRRHLGAEIPTDLMLLLKSFCANVVTWRLKKDRLRRFLAASVHDVMKSTL
eukprot:CAMPEP_0197056396 /NCGR_PEP_ID=MMETSP1384-20130603/83969_1 /TAXON_ID=29189 /ORGANISM="Ammonia sp." /LENGTH=69 /DNA_ID=CAMNT_0042490359 /DNA_START=42 /DNA_END=248 /DNA_ORIENTATION=-